MLIADWTKAFETKKKLESDLTGFKLPHKYYEGWIETPDDTVYITPLIDGRQADGLRGYDVQVWNNPKARAELARLLGMPVVQQGFSYSKKK